MTTTIPTPREQIVRVFGPSHGRSGPVHADNNAFGGLSWCGRRAQYRHWQRPGSINDVNCDDCLRAIKKNRPRAWRRKR